MTKFITLEKLNSLLANVKAEKLVQSYNKSNPGKLSLDKTEKRMTLVKVVMRVDAFKTPAGVPFYAFKKQIGKMTVLVDVLTGSTQMFATCAFASATNVTGKFRIHGVTYDLKDEINGHKRYRPISSEPKKPRKKINVNEFKY